MIRSMLTACAFALTAPSAMLLAHAEQTAAEIGPRVGTTAPEFAAISANGGAVDLTAISGPKGAAFVFSRSLDWCPFCKKQAAELEAVAAPLAKTGWQLNLITYDAPSTLAGFADAAGITYTLLSDRDSAMIDAFGLRNTGVPEGSAFDGIPHPAIIFVDTAGTIRAYIREEGYKDRPAPDLILETAGLLNAAQAE